MGVQAAWSACSTPQGISGSQAEMIHHYSPTPIQQQMPSFQATVNALDISECRLQLDLRSLEEIAEDKGSALFSKVAHARYYR